MSKTSWILILVAVGVGLATRRAFEKRKPPLRVLRDVDI
jgi:hypothetical protein